MTATVTQAQQLEPRAYSPAPIGVNFLGLGSLYSSGGVVTDPSLPIQNVAATFSLPLTRDQSLKLAWTQGVSTRIGASLETFALTWQWVWL